MPETLRSRTARASLYLLRENLNDLRRYADDPDPDTIDRLVKTAELTSTTIKKLLAWISDEPKNEVSSVSSPRIEPVALLKALEAIQTDSICHQCGFPLRTDR